MPKLHANKSIILKTLYGFLVGMFIIAGVCELYFVVQRRLSFQRMKEYAISRGNIYFARNATEAFAESLWEKPWESYRPDAILDVKVGQERYVVKINSQGFRTREFEKEKPAGVYRVICIGGSTTVQGKTNQDTYPALLEKTLQKRYPEFVIEVLNFGISKTGSDYWLRRLDRLFGFQPDLIIQYNAINDISWKLMGSGPCTHTFTYRGINALNYSFLFQKLYPIDGSLFDECFMTILHNFSRMSEIARSKG
ncbi:MAG: SGNH/GDSL hydrolase family protein, partial [Deltaproteobacteria bacterium]|nr:SGNH/GDSL hydrolase family protein [Deltaproteobacteria bacterium]